MRRATSRAANAARLRSSGRIGTTGTTSAAPIRGCAPTCSRRSIRSRAHATPATSASTIAASSPTSVNTDRLWSASAWTSSTSACAEIAAPIASIVARSRPSEKFGTASSGSVTARTLVPLTRRRSSYRSLASLQRDLRVCRACVEAGYPLESLPVSNPRLGQRAYMYGQAPGPNEGKERRPWRGRAGQTLRGWLQMDEDTFYSTFYCASVTRCYPGKNPTGKGDRVPTPREQELCEFWRDWELELIRPHLIVPVGRLAIGRMLG